MAIDIEVVKDDLETLFVQLNLTGLSTTGKYDLLRLQVRYLGKDDTGTRIYEREIPDRRELWSSVGHRIYWTPGTTTATVRDYEAPTRPVKYFLVPSSAVSPAEYTDWATPYPVERGVLDDTVVHFNQDIADAHLGEEPEEGHIVVRSTADLAKYVTACVMEMEGPTYVSRGTEHAVLGSQFPVYIADTRAARRGTITLMTRQLGQYLDLKNICFPSTGLIAPVAFQGGGGNTLLLDDLRAIPLDVEVEQATASNGSMRYVHIAYIEIDGTAPLIARSGDNDSQLTAPVSNFTVSDSTPARSQWVTLASTSTGVFDQYEWTIERGLETDNLVGKFYTAGPHKVRWGRAGRKTVKLRVSGKFSGAHTRTKVITVH
jgi:hypothetical protein